MSKRGSKHPSRESGYVTDKHSGLRAGLKSLQGIYGNKKDTQDKGVARHDFLGEMPLPSCGTLGKIFKLSVLQFSHLSSGDNKNTYFTGPFQRLKGFIYVKPLPSPWNTAVIGTKGGVGIRQGKRVTCGRGHAEFLERWGRLGIVMQLEGHQEIFSESYCFDIHCSFDL